MTPEGVQARFLTQSSTTINLKNTNNPEAVTFPENNGFEKVLLN